MISFRQWLNEVDSTKLASSQLGVSPFDNHTSLKYAVDDRYAPENGEVEILLNDLQKVTPGHFFGLKSDLREALFQTALVKAIRTGIAKGLKPLIQNNINKNIQIFVSQILRISFQQCVQLMDEHKVIVHQILQQMATQGAAA